MAEKVSDISSTAILDSASILYQRQNITNAFALKGLMDKVKSMTTTEIITRRKSQVLYNVLHHTCAGTLHTEIFSLTTYT